MKNDFKPFPQGGWDWSPPWHDNGQSLLELIEHVRKQNLTDLEMRRYWIFVCGSMMNALYYDLTVAKSVGEIDSEA